MKRRKFLVLASMATALIHPTRTIACFGDADAKPTYTTRWIALKTALQRPHFYYAADNMSVFLPPNFVGNHTHPIAAEIMSVAPLSDHTDIHRGLILNEHDVIDVRFVVADALERGVAVVYSTRRRKFVSQVKLVTVSHVCRGGREFYVSDESGEDKILWTTDYVS